MDQIHATAVDIVGAGVLLTGDSGSGKSDLALRLIEAGARLIADDRVDLSPTEGRVAAAAPARLAGLLEVRGVGIVETPHVSDVPLALVVRLVPAAEVPRLPDDETVEVAGVSLPVVRLAAFEASAPAKVRLALDIALAKRGRLAPDVSLGERDAS